MSASHTARITECAEDAIRSGVFPGCVVGVITRSGERTVLPFGRLTYAEDAFAVHEQTIYDVASLTKSIPTACLALGLLEAGRIALDEKITTYIPEFNNAQRETTTVRHLLTHTVFASGLSELAKKTSDPWQLYDAILTRDFENEPGKRFVYTNTPACILGILVSRVTNSDLSRLAEERLFYPLDMVRTTFFPLRNGSVAEVAPTEIDDWRGLVQGLIHDESAFVLMGERIIAGHAGLFSTVPDLLNFLECLLHEGTYGPHRVFKPETVALMSENAIPHLPEKTALGFELSQEHFMGKFAGSHTLGKTGFTGTSFLCDPEKGVGLVLLSNRTWPKRPKDTEAINGVRRQLADIVLGD